MKNAIARSAKTAPVRQCAIFRVPFCDVELVEIKQVEDGEPATNTLTAEQSFHKTLLSEHIENASSLYLNYLKFKEQVELHQLMPDKAVMAELADLRRQHETYELWREEQDEALKELEAQQQLTETQLEAMTEEQKEAHEAAGEEAKKQLEDEIAQMEATDKENAARIQVLLQEARRSLDDENKAKTGYFGDKVYEGSFLPSKETVNCVSSIMSAMVSQIAAERDEQSVSEVEASTEPETLDDLFDCFQEEIAYDTNLREREPADEDFEQEPLKGTLARDFNVYETYDTSTVPLQTLPAAMVDEYKSSAKLISEREKNAARGLVLPGCARHAMPEVPSKSERLRNIENPQFYPFSTLPIEDAERMMQLRDFSALMRQNNVYENQMGKDKQARNKVFERKYDEYLEPDNFRQVVQKALLFDPDVSTAYYPRTDKLLLLLHNKVNGSKRHSENKEKPHSIRRWKTSDRVMPDFQSFIDNFAPNCIQADPEYNPVTDADPPTKLVLAQDMLPKALLDLDGQRVLSVCQNQQQYFPDDNSIMTSEEYEVGGSKRVRSFVHKNETNFGFRHLEDKESSYLPVPDQTGLVQYKPVGKHQFWLNFSDKETKLTVDNVEVVRNKRHMVEVPPPEKTEEEKKAEEEAKAAAAAAAAKAPKGGKAAATPVEQVEEVPPEPIYEEAPPNFLDEIFTDADIGEASRGPCSTLTLKNGLIVRHMPCGEIVQIKDHQLEKSNDPKREVDRVYLPKGIVVRHFANLDCEVLYPKGEVAEFNRAELKWTLTNEKGFRREVQDGKSKDLPPINCLKQTETGTGIVTKMRADRVIMIRYDSGALYCQHADGT